MLVREEWAISAETPNLVTLVECRMNVTVQIFLYWLLLCVYTHLILIVFNCVVVIDLINCAMGLYHTKVMMTCVASHCDLRNCLTVPFPLLGSKPAVDPMSQAWQVLNVYGFQNTDRGLEWYADKVTGREGVSVGVQCSCDCYWIKPFVVNKPLSLVWLWVVVVLN